MRLDELIAEYERLGPALRGGAPEESWWDAFKRELGSVVADPPRGAPVAQARAATTGRWPAGGGEVDAALAETMRLPGAARAPPWVSQARRYVAAHRALDEIESAALLAKNGAANSRLKRLGKSSPDAILHRRRNSCVQTR